MTTATMLKTVSDYRDECAAEMFAADAAGEYTAAGILAREHFRLARLERYLEERAAR